MVLGHMVKWKTRTETTNIGVLELGNLTFDDDYMEVSIDICDMSDNLKEEVEKIIEAGKIKYSEEKEILNKEKGTHWNTVWSNEPVVMDFTYLRVILKAGEPIDYSIEVGFSDAIDRNMNQWNCSIAVDLSEYANELKKAVVKALIDKFF